MSLSLQKACCHYGNVQVLQEVDLQLEKGEIVGLLGRNGAGKTTLLKTIMGLVKTSSGEIWLDDEQLNTLAAHEIPKHGIGYVPQGRRLFPCLSVKENLEMGLLTRNSNAEVMTHALNLFPELKTRLQQHAGTLSGGQQQMVATARALCIKPDYLLLDEPSEGLQPSLVETVLQTALELGKQNVGVLLVEQKVETVLRIADRVLFLENGFLRHESTPDKLKENPGPLYQYVGVRQN